ncbi:MAG TPA: hypothetical protein PLC03_09470, partial [Microthrixaceae bacterium]|nr:hypothetical protein [Microthrixaceae bacterium]
MTSPGLAERSLLLHGLGLTNLAVARAAVAHGVAVVASDDSSPDSASTLADDLGIEVVLGPSAEQLD